MKTTVNGRNYNVTEDQKLKIAKKLERFDKFFGDDARGNAVLRRTKHGEIVEITLSAGGMLYRSEVEDTTWINALDRAVEHIERQIRKNKTRLAKRLRDDSFRVPTEETDPIPLDIAELEEGDFEIHEKRFPIKPMTAQEAILQMNLLDHSFFVFKDESGEMHVVYKRKDGAYGLISDEIE